MLMTINRPTKNGTLPSGEPCGARHYGINQNGVPTLLPYYCHDFRNCASCFNRRMEEVNQAIEHSRYAELLPQNEADKRKRWLRENGQRAAYRQYPTEHGEVLLHNVDDWGGELTITTNLVYAMTLTPNDRRTSGDLGKEAEEDRGDYTPVEYTPIEIDHIPEEKWIPARIAAAERIIDKYERYDARLAQQIFDDYEDAFEDELISRFTLGGYRGLPTVVRVYHREIDAGFAPLKEWIARQLTYKSTTVKKEHVLSDGASQEEIAEISTRGQKNQYADKTEAGMGRGKRIMEGEL